MTSPGLHNEESGTFPGATAPFCILVDCNDGARRRARAITSELKEEPFYTWYMCARAPNFHFQRIKCGTIISTASVARM